MGKKKKQDEVKKGLDEWMGTYADMITLLFCFFVLLYAASNRDDIKLQYILQSASTGGEFINVIVNDTAQTVDGDGIENSKLPPLEVGTGGSGGQVISIGQGNEPDTFEKMFNWVSKAIADAELEDSASIEATSNKVNICLDNDLLFEPNSAVLKAEGIAALSTFVPAIKTTEKYISSLQVIGHTAAVQGGVSPINDWDLSSARAAAVLKFFEDARAVSGSKMKLEAFAQYRPISDNVTELGRSKNRRVEIIITRNPVDFMDGELLEDILQYDYNWNLGMVDDDGNPIVKPKPSPDTVIGAIISELEKKYGEDGDGGDLTDGSTVGPQIGENPIDIPDSDYVVTEETDGENGNETAGDNAEDATE